MSNDIKPWLIQRLIRNCVESCLSDKRFGEVFSLDYMGSSEYEFGTFPKMLRAMNASNLDKTTVRINDVKYFVVYSPAMGCATADDVTQLIQKVANGARLKEQAYFPVDPKRAYGKADAWADIEHGIIWTAESMSNAIVNMIANSVKYMDEQKNKLTESD